MMGRWQQAAMVAVLLGPAATLAACGGTFLQQSGIIKSPKYPRSYPHNKECVYTILASPDARIRFHCSVMNLEWSAGCVSDSLSVNGLHKCGKSLFTTMFGDGSLTIKFKSNGSKSKKRGFRCHYFRVSGGDFEGSTDTPTPTTCGTQPSTPEPTTPQGTQPSPTPEPTTPQGTQPSPTPKPTIPQGTQPPTTQDPTTPRASKPLPTTSNTSTSTICSTPNAEFDYDEVLHKSLLFYEAQRSGRLPESQRVLWRRDSATNDAIDPDTNQRVDLEGGYYDAGDYVKFGYPMAGAATVLAWGAIEYGEAYQSAGEMMNMLAAVRWATEYFIKAHVKPTVFYGQVGNGQLDHQYWGRPEDMTMSRPAYKITEGSPGSDLAGETAAALAAASVLFQAFDPIHSAACLNHSQQLYNFANTYRGKYSDSISDATQFYYSYGVYYDELAWAAAWLYRATGDRDYLRQARDHYSALTPSSVGEFSWAEKAPGVMVLLAQLADAADRQKYAEDLQSFCNRIVREKPRTPKGLVYISQWGSLRYAANVAFVCLRAADLGINSEEYRNFGQQQIHYMLGSTGRSYVVGFGQNSPQRPHHASSSCRNPPEPCSWNDFQRSDPNPQVLYGALVGGPDEYDSYADVRYDYVANEVACDYNAGFQSAVAALRHQAGCGDGSARTTTNSIASTTTYSNERITTSPATASTSGSQSTPGGGGNASCASVTETNQWAGNFQANLVVKVPTSTSVWAITLTFSATVDEFQVWVAEASSTPSTSITLTNMPYNGQQTDADTLTINFIATYSGAKPQVTAVTFNNTPLCLY